MTIDEHSREPFARKSSVWWPVYRETILQIKYRKKDVFSVYVRKQKHLLMTLWCDVNIGKEGLVWVYGYEGTGGPMIYSFRTEEELMWFSLVWGDQIVIQRPVG